MNTNASVPAPSTVPTVTTSAPPFPALHPSETAFFFIGGCGGTSPAPAVKIHAGPSGSGPMADETPVGPHSFRTEFGTNTTALGIVLPGGMGIFIDNGTGIPRVAEFFRERQVTGVNGLQTHFHMDHRAGVQSNAMLFRSGYVRSIHTPILPGRSFREVLAGDFSPDTWPVSPQTFGIEHSIQEFALGSELQVGDVSVKTLPLNHPGQAAGFRITLPHGDVVVTTDEELSDDAHRTEYAKFVSGAAILYVDVQYRDEEHAGQAGIGGGPAMSRKGWGHSTPGMLRAALSQCEKVPGTILVGHHDPSRPDADLRKFEAEMQAEFAEAFPGTKLCFAREADTFRV